MNRLDKIHSRLLASLLFITVSIATAQDLSPSPIRITVDRSAAPLTNFMGLGIEFDPFQNQPVPDRWATILKRVSYARPGFLRVMSSARDYCIGFDSSGAPIYLWSHPDATTQKNLDKLLAILDYAQQQNIDVFLGEWSPPHELGIERPDDPRWARIIADFVQYLILEKHYSVIRHYIFFNEPNGQWMWKHSGPDYPAWSAGIKNLRHELDARNLQSVLLAGPDNSGDPSWFARSIRDLSPQLGAWESHIYATDAQIYNDRIESELSDAKTLILKTDPRGASKERFIAESGLQDGKNEELDQQPRVRSFDYGVLMADYVAQIARAGWMGADAWDLDDAMHGNGHNGLKLWGFWDSSTTSDMAIRPWFYTWSLMSRLFPKGATILRVDTNQPIARLRSTAASWTSTKGDETTIMVVNDDDIPRSIVVHTATAAHCLYLYRYFDDERPISPSGFPIPSATLADIRSDQTLKLEMPSRGVIFLTTAHL